MKNTWMQSPGFRPAVMPTFISSWSHLRRQESRWAFRGMWPLFGRTNDDGRSKGGTRDRGSPCIAQGRRHYPGRLHGRRHHGAGRRQASGNPYKSGRQGDAAGERIGLLTINKSRYLNSTKVLFTVQGMEARVSQSVPTGDVPSEVLARARTLACQCGSPPQSLEREFQKA